ncbi:short-chain alcohol dehydrogenase [Sanguibacter keddieii DSM 10542]|uniref:Short-chain alcohol dehydrogenase n=1 Tax=Sanguibacter keddieii (strain ATCC 51767 / DSM 10542 / NCFB 3025 / ST-74) TaxID=446469 RepID=D1BG72_SANKS|nr:SDR family oxidoreductase [Sanguibacter keddieii]ACZ23589.1 short-chain alcohol dehydrogenase [Sanguibacter keddieii DSM 10542]
MTSLHNAVVLVTGANGGIGSSFVRAALARGAARVYATARSPRAWDDERVVPLTLDVTDPASVAAAVEAAPDVTVLVNNAGGLPQTASILEVDEADLRQTMEINFFAPLLVARAFAPALRAADGAVLVDMHSVASWLASGGPYSASKAALWSATNSLRVELAPHGVLVTGVHVGYVDTAMAAHADGPKMAPDDLVTAVLDGVEAGAHEVVADELSAAVKAGLSGPVEALYPELVHADDHAGA